MTTRRVLKAVAHNLIDSLLSGPYGLQDGSLLDHLERAARVAGSEVVTVDLLSGSIEPSDAATPSLRRLGATAVKRLRELVAGLGLSMAAVVEAALVYEVVPHNDEARGSQGIPCLTVRLCDDLGHQYAFVCPEQWLPSVPAPFGVAAIGDPLEGRSYGSSASSGPAQERLWRVRFAVRPRVTKDLPVYTSSVAGRVLVIKRASP